MPFYSRRAPPCPASFARIPCPIPGIRYILLTEVALQFHPKHTHTFLIYWRPKTIHNPPPPLNHLFRPYSPPPTLHVLPTPKPNSPGRNDYGLPLTYNLNLSAAIIIKQSS